MRCIICQNEMEQKIIADVEIDLCNYCGGVWLDQGEFERLSGIDPSKYRKLDCQNCGSQMVTRTIQNVEIDLCPDCGGVWLDNGELEKIVGLNPFGSFGKNEFQLFRDAVMMSRELERFAKLDLKRREEDPMIINDVFLIYIDGCMIVHKTRRLKPEMDDDILSAMFMAITNFIEDSFKDVKAPELTALTFGDGQIIIERGQWTFIAAFISGRIPKNIHEVLKRTVTDIEAEYGEVLRDWNHQYKALLGAQDIIAKHLMG